MRIDQDNTSSTPPRQVVLSRSTSKTSQAETKDNGDRIESIKFLNALQQSPEAPPLRELLEIRSTEQINQHQMQPKRALFEDPPHPSPENPWQPPQLEPPRTNRRTLEVRKVNRNSEQPNQTRNPRNHENVTQVDSTFRRNQRDEVLSELKLTEYPNPQNQTPLIYIRDTNIQLSHGYERICYGDGGAYIEMDPGSITAVLTNTYSGNYYHLYSSDQSNAQIYLQRRTVEDRPNPPRSLVTRDERNRPGGYADYRIGRAYLAVQDAEIRYEFSSACHKIDASNRNFGAPARPKPPNPRK